MREAIKIFRRFLPPYKGLIALNILVNLLGALFNLFSIVTLIPVLEILFSPEIKQDHFMQHISFSEMSFSEIRHVITSYSIHYTKLYDGLDAQIYQGIPTD